MFGIGVLKGMAVTFKNFVESYYKKERLTTIEYPEKRLAEKERFRNFPFLIFDEKPEDPRCVACDICAKECPPQCITIVRAQDAQGKPLKKPATFDIDYSICMNCGVCEEVCPFDAIFMDHEFELAEYGRFEDLNYTIDRLLKPKEHFMKIRPTDATRIEAELKKKENAKKAAAEKAAAAAKAKAEAAKTQASQVPDTKPETKPNEPAQPADPPAEAK
ncbi:MAG: 4Fe-4S ferredoxin [Candidatus Omnitrophica bacterium CG11_big_fil_rev_8_21_14_0_20_45_26]|uniref:4Fe-4S ferredoxin n=1 Tax=Candidatus Abzuiibacterium crystallinum TaxID=1974748 RepID=A0A2H0LPR8_9BACT|nr:MAG: 4Fe-4S ferredoxin [Candidatus Omnitrophica bacterium CG11_big_fil_rev_8_21_14_0_20_45_26]PIW63675.1 MAG: 4Fe-4S ferredoxin [Candidatus Omnitrophica bacterium CG12_big_fil_rev_8_21_14_0_65_45_16]